MLAEQNLETVEEIDRSLCAAGLSLHAQLTVLTELLAARLASLGTADQVRKMTIGANEILTRTVNDRLAAKRRMLS